MNESFQPSSGERAAASTTDPQQPGEPSKRRLVLLALSGAAVLGLSAALLLGGSGDGDVAPVAVPAAGQQAASPLAPATPTPTPSAVASRQLDHAGAKDPFASLIKPAAATSAPVAETTTGPAAGGAGDPATVPGPGTAPTAGPAPMSAPTATSSSGAGDVTSRSVLLEMHRPSAAEAATTGRGEAAIFRVWEPATAVGKTPSVYTVRPGDTFGRYFTLRSLTYNASAAESCARVGYEQQVLRLCTGDRVNLT